MARIKPDDLMESVDKGLAIFNPSPENAEIVIDWILPEIDIEQLKRALYYFSLHHQTKDPKYLKYFDPIPRLFRDYSVGRYERVVRRIGRQWWKYIGEFVRDRSRVTDQLIGKKPALKPLLNSQSGQAYMDYYTQRLYNFFSVWFWSFPRYHSGCGGVIKYGQVDRRLDLWGFYCRRCKTPVPYEYLERLTYIHRAHGVGKKRGKQK